MTSGVPDRPILFYAPRSSALAPRLVLADAGADHVLQRVDLAGGEQRTTEFLARNALGRVPVLVDGVFTLTENTAILAYLARRHPETGLWPETRHDEARCLEWLAWGASSLHPTMAHVRRPERYATSAAARAEVVTTARRTLEGLFTITERRLATSDWAAGDRPSVADFYLLFFWLWGPAPEGRTDTYPRLTRIADRLIARPAVAKVLREEGHIAS